MTSPHESDLEAPDGDWVEQHQPLSVDPEDPDAGSAALPLPGDLPGEADPADVQEQAVPVSDGDAEDQYPVQ